MNKIYSLIILVLIFTTTFSVLSGTEPVWETVHSYSSISQDHGRMCAYDNQNNLYIAGTFTNNIVIEGVQYSCRFPNIGNNLDIFVAKFDSLNVCQWVNIIGGCDRDDIYGLKISNNGDIFIAGHVSSGVIFSNDFAPTVGTWDGFAAKLNSDGQFLWVNTFGNDTIDFVYDLELDSHDNIYIAGHFQGTVNHGPNTLISQGDKDIFVTKIDSTGNFVWSESAGGIGTDYALALSINEQYNSTEVYVVGVCEVTCQFGNLQLPTAGGAEGFVARLDNNHNWDFVKTFVCGSTDCTTDVFVDSNSNIYIAGFYTNNIIIDDFYLQANTSGTNSYLFKMDNEGELDWLESITDAGHNRIYRITPGNDDNLIICGMIGSDANFGSAFTGPSGNTQIYVSEISTSGTWNWLKTTQQESDIANDYHLANVRCTAVNSNNDIAVTGSVNGYCFFDNYSVQSYLCLGGEDDNDAFWAILHPDSTITAVDEDYCANYTVKLHGNFPNPFNPETRIEFSLAKDEVVNLSIYNIKGQKIKTFKERYFSKGDNSVIWNGTDGDSNPCSSGVYFFKLDTGKEVQTQKMLLLK